MFKILHSDSCSAKERPWYEAAAEAGEPDAQYNLAALLHQTNPERAQALLRQAAVQGHFVAQMELGTMLL